MTHPDTSEISAPSTRISTPAGLPDVPGGWTEKRLTIEGHTFELVLPAAPDAFLEDDEVQQAFDRDEYMPYWAYLWPASLKMAATILKRDWPNGARVLELGAGVGIAGLAGLAKGLHVTFTDYEAKSVDLCLFNARRTGYVDVSGYVLDWRTPPDTTFPFIWGCDLLYEDRNHVPILELTRKILEPGGIAWYVDGGRAKAERFFRLSSEFGLRSAIYDEEFQPLASPRVGRYQLIELRHAGS